VAFVPLFQPLAVFYLLFAGFFYSINFVLFSNLFTVAFVPFFLLCLFYPNKGIYALVNYFFTVSFYFTVG